MRLIGIAIGVIAALLFAASASPLQEISSDEPNAKDVEIRVIPAKNGFQLGETVVLRVEIWNLGRKVFYGPHVLSPNTSAPASLWTYFTNEKGEQFPGGGGDAIFSQGAINDYWNQIYPYHFYGLEDSFEPKDRDFLLEPGKFQVKAVYKSKGGITPPNPEWEILSHKIWAGTIESKPVSITILRSKNPVQMK